MMVPNNILRDFRLLYLRQEDDLMHLCWKVLSIFQTLHAGTNELTWFSLQDRKTNAVEDDLIIFPNDAQLHKVTQSTGRVYVLKFQSSSQRLFFWLQGMCCS